MRIEKVDKNNPDKEIISHAVEILKRGGVLVIPTETAYGLAADATNKKAVEKIYRIKGRSFKKFLPLIAGSNCKVREYFKVSGREDKLLKNYKGLSITLGVKSKKIYLLPKQESCVVRVSTSDVARAIAKKLGRPITATSANVSGEENCYSIAQVVRQLSKQKYQLDLILDAGRLVKKNPSTIVKVEGKEIKVLRQGEVRVK